MHRPLTIVEGPYLRDILDQAEAIRRTVAALGQPGALRARCQALRQERGVNRVVLTGMGGSLHAFHPLQIRLNQAGWFSQMMETSELMAYNREVLTPRTLTIVVSQSGETAEVVRLLRDGFVTGPLIGITNTAGSTVANHSTLPLITEAGPEFTVSCKTFLVSLVALHWLGSCLLDEDNAALPAAIETVRQGVAHYIASWRSHVEWFATQLSGVRRVFVTGRGWSLATAGTGGLILKESTRIAAEGLSSAAFRHGPFESLSDEVLVCICEGDPRTASLNHKLHDDVLSAGGRSFLLSPQAKPEALRLPAVAPELLPLVEMLPVQMMSLAIAALKGEEAGRFRLLTKVTTVE